MIINQLLLPSSILIVIMYGILKKLNIYDLFINGCKEGIKLTIQIIPTYFAMIFAINIFINSGIIEWIGNNIFFLPITIKRILPMALVRPISGTASLAILNQLLKQYGPDSLLGLIASTIQGCTDTTFYVIALYFGSIGIKKIRYALIVGLIADIIGIITAIVVVYLCFN